MAHDNTEIEIKIPVSEKDFNRVKKIISDEAEFIHELHHIDTYYNNMNIDFLKSKVPDTWLSIRKRGDRVIVNYKKWHKNDGEEYTHCDEFETDINDAEQMYQIFRSMDIVPLVTVDKTRWKYKYKDEFEICMDKVKELGFFVEIETVKDFGSVKRAREKIIEYANRLGLKQTKTVPGGYAFQLMKSLSEK